MSLNPRLLKKLNDADTVAAAGRKAILRAEYNSIRGDIRTASSALLSFPAYKSIPTYCAALRDLLDELEELATLLYTSDKDLSTGDSHDHDES